jgi:hypothetical protein
LNSKLNQLRKGRRNPFFEKNEILSKMPMISMGGMRIFSSFGKYSSCWLKGLKDYKNKKIMKGGINGAVYYKNGQKGQAEILW